MPHPIPGPGRVTCVRPSGPEHCHHLQVEVVCCLPLEPEGLHLVAVLRVTALSRVSGTEGEGKRKKIAERQG